MYTSLCTITDHYLSAGHVRTLLSQIENVLYECVIVIVQFHIYLEEAALGITKAIVEGQSLVVYCKGKYSGGQLVARRKSHSGASTSAWFTPR